jgi:hypothetical protein
VFAGHVILQGVSHPLLPPAPNGAADKQKQLERYYEQMRKSKD